MEDHTYPYIEFLFAYPSGRVGKSQCFTKDYALYSVARVDGGWKKLDHFPITIAFDYYESDEEAIKEFRKAALEHLCHDTYAYLPVDSSTFTYMIYDETSDKILSVFTLEVRLKEEKI